MLAKTIALEVSGKAAAIIENVVVDTVILTLADQNIDSCYIISIPSELIKKFICCGIQNLAFRHQSALKSAYTAASSA